MANKEGRKMRIFIDPEYGGPLFGGKAIYNGEIIYGKNITWQIAMFLREIIERTTHNQVFLSRGGDVCLSPEKREGFEGIERAMLCNKYKCNVAISIGVRNNKTNKEDRGSSILYGRTMTTKSRQLASCLWKYTKEQIKEIPNRVFLGGHSYFLMICQCDAVEYKPITISNQRDLEFIADIQNQYKVAKTIYDALRDFYGLHFKLKSDIIL